MDYSKFIEPKNIEIGGRTFATSLIPAVDALTIHNTIAKVIAENGLLGITMLPTNVDKQILNYTAYIDGNIKIVPSTDTLINDIFKGKVKDIKELVIAMVKENFGFLITGDLLDKLADLVEATDSVS